MRTLITLLIVSTIISAYSQKLEIKGHVREINSNKTPIAQVQIDFYEAITTTSDDEGNFVLAFADKTFGQNAYMKAAHKNGYEVVNGKELKPLTLNKTNEVVIIFCKAGYIDKMKAEYYEISENNLTFKYRKREKELIEKLENEKSNKDSVFKQLEVINQQHQSALERLNSLVDKFARTNFDDVSDLYQKAFDLFKQGKIDDAIAVLEDKDLIAEANKVIEEEKKIKIIRQETDKREATKNTKRDVLFKNLKLKADLHLTNFEPNKAGSIFHIICLMDTTNLDNTIAYASFLNKYKRYYEARQWYEKALEVYRELVLKYPESYNSDVAMVLNNLGALYSDLQSYSEAIDAYTEALEIYRKLTLKYPESYNSDVAMVLNNLGVLYRDLQFYSEAKNAYTEALEIYRELTLKYPESYNSDMANSLNNIGVLYSDLQSYSEAKNAYTEALEIYRDLALKYPESYNSDVAIVLNNLGVLYSYLQFYSEAKNAFIKALEIRRKLALKYPEIYISEVAGTLNNLGIFYRILKFYSEAKNAHLEALEIYRELALKYPESYNSDVAMVLNNFGVLYSDLQSYSEAKNAYTEALEIYRELTLKYHESYNSEVASILYYLGDLYFDEGDNIQALKHYTLCKENREIIYRNDTTNTRVLYSIGLTFNRIGDINKELKNIDKAAENYLKSKAIWEKLYKMTGNEDYIDNASYFQKAIEELYKTNADRIAEEQALIVQYQKEMQTDSIFYLTGSAYGSLSWYFLFEKEFEKAEIAARKSLTYGKEMEWVNTNLAHAILFQNKYEEAKTIYIKYKDKQNILDKTKLNNYYFLQDFKDLEAEGITHPDLERIRNILENN